MTREELIKSLRCCSNPKNASCLNCALFDSNCADRCSDDLMQAAADMLEQDGKQEKTADEMFRELGYCQKGTVGCGVRYDTKEKLNGFFSAKAIVLNTKEGVAEKAEYPKGFGRPFEFAELRAVCKLLDEMGVE